VHLVGGNGGASWFQLLFPHTDVAKANNPSFAFHAPGSAEQVQGTDNELWRAPEAPFKNLRPSRQISAFMAGTAENHTQTPRVAAQIATGVDMIATVAAIQQASPTLVPVIGMGQFTYGVAPGAPPATPVRDANGLVELFNSAASKSILASPKAAALGESYYKTFLSLNAAARRTSVQGAYGNGKVAANLLGQNLAAQLKPTSDDLVRYGIASGVRSAIAEIGKSLCTTAKAFRLGLTSCVVVPYMLDDPHDAFAQGTTAPASTVAVLGKMLDAFMTDLAGIQDPSHCGKTLADQIVMTVHGDTPKTPLQAQTWPDSTPSVGANDPGSNWVYVFGCGYLKTGWFGGVRANGQVDGFDVTSGKVVQNQPSLVTTTAASAAVAYAVSKGDQRRVTDFYRGTWIAGLVNSMQT
jgi:hypothetical protein